MNEYIASLYIARRPEYEPKPHTPSISTVEAKRQRRAKRRAVNLRQLRLLKSRTK